MDVEDAGFSVAAPVLFCRFLHPSMHLSIPPPCSTVNLNPSLNTGAIPPTLTERFTKSFSSFLQIIAKQIASCRTLQFPHWPFSVFKNSAIHLKSWRMLISSGCAEPGEIQKKAPTRWLVWCLIVYMNSTVICVFRNYPLQGLRNTAELLLPEL